MWNDVPYPLLIIPNANLSYTLQKESFALMNPMEFIADNYVSWEAIYYMNGALFNRLPLIKRLGWREVIDFKGFYGSLRPGNMPDATNSHNLFLFPTPTRQTVTERTMLTSTPYMELSFGIANIFKGLHFQFQQGFINRNSAVTDTFQYVSDIAHHLTSKSREIDL